MTNGMRHEVMTDRERRMLNRINRRIARSTWWYRTKYKLLHPFLKLMPAREIVWRETYGGSYPACPRCGMVFISRELAKGRMAEVELLMEDK